MILRLLKNALIKDAIDRVIYGAVTIRCGESRTSGKEAGSRDKSCLEGQAETLGEW